MEKNKYIIYFFILLLIIILYKQYRLHNHFDSLLPEWVESDTKTHILFTRYKEPDMTVLLKPIVNKKNVEIFIYNKGDNIPTGIPDDATNITIISIPNLGWDSYAYFIHVIKYYDNLPDYIYLFHASAEYLNHKYNLTKTLLEIKDKNIFFASQYATCNLDFRLTEWNATLQFNKITNSTNVFEPSKIYPYGKWLQQKIGKIPDKFLINDNTIMASMVGIFMVHKSRIIKYPITFYKDLLDEISVWQSEVNHYLERSWYVFYSD